MRTTLFYTLALLISAGCQEIQDFPRKDEQKATITLELHRQTSKTRAIDETAIEDVNVFFYQSNNLGLVHHFYATGTSHTIDINPGDYTICIAANIHKDMGNLSWDAISQYLVERPVDGSVTMFGMTRSNITLTTRIISAKVTRNAAKIGYNITVSPEAGDMDILSVQLCSIPNKDYLYYDDRAELPNPTGGFSNSEVRTMPAATKNTAGIFYMLSNRRGEVTSITSQEQKNADKAPANASYLRIRTRKGNNKVLDYCIYLGANNTYDFNVWQNDAHTYNITIKGDNITDTRITGYTLEVTESWPRNKYCVPGDVGQLNITASVTGNYEFFGRLEAIKGDGVNFKYRDMMWHTGPRHDIWVYEGDTQYGLGYEPALITKDMNSQLQYTVSIFDDFDECTVFTFTREFANMVQAHFPAAAGSVSVSQALDQTSSASLATAFCYEDGCTFVADGRNGYLFDGWYADETYKELLSASASFDFVPTKAVTDIYAKFGLQKQPKVEIRCSEANKNSTYMYNRNTVSMTVTDYTGTLTITANCTAGGLFTSATSFTKTVTSGQTFTLDPLVFVPTATGDISYTIDVKTSAGISIASKTVTNTITATRLTPTINIKYAEWYNVKKYRPSGMSNDVYWGGYEKVIAKVAFSPALDYPAPLANKQLLHIKMSPQKAVFRVGSEDWMDGNGDVWPVPVIESTVINGGDLKEFDASYIGSITDSPDYILQAGQNFKENIYFHPLSEGMDDLYLPQFTTQAINADMDDYTFIEYKFKEGTPQDYEFKLTSINPLTTIVVDTDTQKITFINEL